MKSIEKLRKMAMDFRSDVYKRDEADYVGEIADEIEAEIAERYMQLPVDADGLPIHMGDAIEGKPLFDNATVRGTVCAYHIHDDDEPGTVYIKVKPTEDTWTIKELRFERCRHVMPDPLKELLEELVNHVTPDVEWEPELFDGYAQRIRELMEVDNG